MTTARGPFEHNPPEELNMVFRALSAVTYILLRRCFIFFDFGVTILPKSQTAYLTVYRIVDHLLVFLFLDSLLHSRILDNETEHYIVYCLFIVIQFLDYLLSVLVEPLLFAKSSDNSSQHRFLRLWYPCLYSFTRNH